MIDIVNNGAGLFVITILFATFLWGMARGLIGSIFKVASSLIAFLICKLLYPTVATFIRGTFIFEGVKNWAIGSLGIQESVNTYTQAQQYSFINSLPLPESFRIDMLENNNNVAYSLLGANNLVDYIGSYIANIVVSIGVGLLLFVLVYCAIRVVAGVLDLFSKLPVIRYYNYAGGGIIGIFWGVVIIWLSFSVVTIFIASPVFYQMYEAIQASSLAKFMYDNNILLNLILNKLL